MNRVLDEIEPEAEKIYFFDADIIVLARWEYFESLVEEGAALVIDHWFPKVSATHPWRRAWAKLCTDAGFSVRYGEDCYGSAFCCILRRHRALIDAWWRLLTTELHKQRADILNSFKPGDRMTDPFSGTDQDLLAAAVMATDLPICTLGPEAYGFTGRAHTMLHPLGEKPWRDRPLRVCRGLAGSQTSIPGTTGVIWICRSWFAKQPAPAAEVRCSGGVGSGAGFTGLLDRNSTDTDANVIRGVPWMVKAKSASSIQRVNGGFSNELEPLFG